MSKRAFQLASGYDGSIRHLPYALEIVGSCLGAMEDGARAKRGVEASEERGSHLKPWTCRNEEGSTLELAEMLEWRRKQPKFETLTSNLLKFHPKMFNKLQWHQKSLLNH